MLTFQRERAYFADDDECWCDRCEEMHPGSDMHYSVSKNMTYCDGCWETLCEGAAEELAIGLEGLIVLQQPMLEAAE